MKTRQIIIALVLIYNLAAEKLYSQEEAKVRGLNAIKESTVQAQLDFLASDWMEGRETGTRGIEMAADYIASMFKVYGIQPAGDVEWDYPSWRETREGKMPVSRATYFQYYSLIEYEPGKEQYLALHRGESDIKKSVTFKFKTDFDVNPGDIGMEIEAPVVFVGYGYRNPDKDYDDFEDVDIKDKIILRLAGFPGHKDSTSEAYKKFRTRGRYSRYYITREKNRTAAELGAAAVIEVDLDNDAQKNWADNLRLRYNSDYYEGEERLTPGIRNRMRLPGDSLRGSMTEIDISLRGAFEIIRGTEVNFEAFEKYSMEKMKSKSVELKGRKLYLKTTVNSNIVSSRNILGKIEGEDPEKVIVVGGHYDHVGANKGYIWNGSDDNASGTVGVMTIAKAFAESGVKPKYTVIFAAWSGEEKGLLGSEYFVANYEPSENIMLYLNYDMISRDSEDDTLGIECGMTYTDTYPDLKDVIERFNSEMGYGLNIEFEGSPRPGGGSDHSSFSAEDIPIYYFEAGWHDDYHRPTDHSDLANINKMTKIIKLGYLSIWHFANTDSPLNRKEGE